MHCALGRANEGSKALVVCISRVKRRLRLASMCLTARAQPWPHNLCIRWQRIHRPDGPALHGLRQCVTILELGAKPKSDEVQLGEEECEHRSANCSRKKFKPNGSRRTAAQQG